MSIVMSSSRENLLLLLLNLQSRANCSVIILVRGLGSTSLVDYYSQYYNLLITTTMRARASQGKEFVCPASSKLEERISSSLEVIAAAAVAYLDRGRSLVSWCREREKREREKERERERYRQWYSQQQYLICLAGIDPTNKPRYRSGQVGNQQRPLSTPLKYLPSWVIAEIYLRTTHSPDSNS